VGVAVISATFSALEHTSDQSLFRGADRHCVDLGTKCSGGRHSVRKSAPDFLPGTEGKQKRMEHPVEGI
jgi:hypothetical protein